MEEVIISRPLESEEEEFIKPKDIKTLSIISDKNNNYDIEYYLSGNKIIFEGLTKNDIPQKKYKKSYSFNNIQSNKYFAMCENIKEVYEEINSQINERKNEIKIIEKKNSILLTFPLNTKKIKECNFEIDEIIPNINAQIKDIYSYINTLIKKIDKLEEKNNALETKNKILEKKNEVLEDNNNKLEKKIDYIYKMLTKEEKFNNKTIHIGIMCNKCGINPIIGYRYKCSICKDYELCDDCAKKNFLTNEHPHHFIIIANEESEKKERKKNDDIVYNYELFDKNPEKFTKKIFEEDNQEDIIFEFDILNIGNADFPADGKTKLIVDKNNSEINLSDIEIEPIEGIKQGNKSKIIVIIPKENIKLGKEKITLLLNIEGQNIGDPIILNLIVKSKIIEDFRAEYNLTEEEYNDEKILDALQKNQFNAEKAFASLFET